MPRRNVAKLTGGVYDVLVIGGGITGACIAWDAALRGLRVALVERDDFGAATSANSLKTVHGGLRYLQDADLAQVRKMVRERQAFLRIAPHLVHPLPCLMPTYRPRPMRSKPVLGAALKFNDLLSFDRNRGMDPARSLPDGRILSREECLAHLPGLADPAVSGGVLWYDAQIQDTERLLLSFILSAANRGADVANYVRVTGLAQKGNRVVGVVAEDRQTGQTLHVRAQVVVNAAGAWVDEILGELNGHQPRTQFNLSAAMNLVTRQILPQPAVGLDSHYQHRLADGTTEERSRVLFVAPWREYSIAGTLHFPYNGHPDNGAVREEMIRAFLDEINRAYPPAELKRSDVHHVHVGFLPAEPNASNGNAVKLVRAEQLTDHAQQGIDGLVTAVGVKYTTARFLAEKTVDLVFRKLDVPGPTCQTRFQRLYGGAILDWTQFQNQTRAMVRQNGISEEVASRLLQTYGSAYAAITSYVKEDPCWGETVSPQSKVMRAEIVHAVRQEMAVTLADVLRRRTALGSAGLPDPGTVQNCAALMADELGWDEQRTKREVDELYAAYAAVTT